MALHLAGVASGLLLLVLQAHPALASNAASTATEYVVVTTGHAYYAKTDIITTTRTVKSWMTPTARPTATSSSTNEYLNLEVVQLYLPAGSVGEWQLDDSDDADLYGGSGDDDGETSTYWVAPVTYTAPRSCPTPFTVQTTETLDLAASETANLHPTSTHTYSGLLGAAETLYLSALPPGVTPSYGYDYQHHIRACETPSSSGGYYTSWDSNMDEDDKEVCMHRRFSYSSYFCMSWRDWIIVLATVLPGLFVLGFIESFLWFRQMMRGRRALRLGTLSWTLISGWVACFIRVSPARDEAEQPALVEQWKALSAGQRWRLWWKWGFRHKYPVEMLGPDPRKMQMGAAAVGGEEAGVPTANANDMGLEGVVQKPEAVHQVQQVQQVEGTTPAAPNKSVTRFLPKVM
ncbi:hypothetical protein PG984_005442 [Apiospora sp. TS-2023a]